MTSSYTAITDHTVEIFGVSINKIKHNFINIYQIGPYTATLRLSNSNRARLAS